MLGDIASIEGYEESTYREIATYIDASNIDVLITYGTTSEMIHSYLSRDLTTMHAHTLAELNQHLRNLSTGSGNSFLFKASRIMQLENSIKEVFPYHYRLMEYQESNKF